MSRSKKANDATEVALSAIEEALKLDNMSANARKPPNQPMHDPLASLPIQQAT